MAAGAQRASDGECDGSRLWKAAPIPIGSLLASPLLPLIWSQWRWARDLSTMKSLQGIAFQISHLSLFRLDMSWWLNWFCHLLVDPLRMYLFSMLSITILSLALVS